ncbi:Sec-independent protein translocase protein TatB [Alteriqipengyuania flavescens]|uniref:Sec-independent protein translocase protein TatB n=1 Tax=Alteriqipengyuania flavescens TaxID=3053610 RepID=UPI0025B3F195|nr:Sec-independent protein translocase protein TatB [Alteriqipengyuania flavescens]WJY19108.1 Sec-independent protein translocase protein TatB [Alteriqipengyuania flavescens]WJY25049.1 Sec-independent protein translocase protein TatB [Alteriqipengyuania flavescens]
MFNIGAEELLLIVVVAILVIGPKDMPLALRTAGRWIGKIRRVSGHFRAGLDSMIREAEMEEMEKKWKAQNEAIMKAHPGAAADVRKTAGEPTNLLPDENGEGPQMQPLAANPDPERDQAADAARERARPKPPSADEAAPRLPLGGEDEV